LEPVSPTKGIAKTSAGSTVARSVRYAARTVPAEHPGNRMIQVEDLTDEQLKIIRAAEHPKR